MGTLLGNPDLRCSGRSQKNVSPPLPPPPICLMASLVFLLVESVLFAQLSQALKRQKRGHLAFWLFRELGLGLSRYIFILYPLFVFVLNKVNCCRREAIKVPQPAFLLSLRTALLEKEKTPRGLNQKQCVFSYHKPRERFVELNGDSFAVYRMGLDLSAQTSPSFLMPLGSVKSCSVGPTLGL